jgi:hypothetical protein
LKRRRKSEHHGLTNKMWTLFLKYIVPKRDKVFVKHMVKFVERESAVEAAVLIKNNIIQFQPDIKVCKEKGVDLQNCRLEDYYIMNSHDREQPELKAEELTGLQKLLLHQAIEEATIKEYNKRMSAKPKFMDWFTRA